MSEFSKAINEVKNVCWPEIEDKDGYHNVIKAGNIAENAIKSASSWTDKLSGNNRIDTATQSLLRMAAKEKMRTSGKSICGDILRGINHAQTHGEFKVEPNTTMQTPKVAKTETAKAPVNNNPGIWWYASNKGLEERMWANGL